VLARPHERSTTKIDSKNSLSPLRYFTEHLVSVFEKLLRENDLDHESLRLPIRWLNSTPGITLQQSHRSLKGKSQLDNHDEKLELEPTTPRTVLGNPGATFSVEESIHGAKHSEQESSLSHRMG
jgi:hypothetical protein